MGEKKKCCWRILRFWLAATFWGMGFVAGDMAAKGVPDLLDYDGAVSGSGGLDGTSVSPRSKE